MKKVIVSTAVFIVSLTTGFSQINNFVWAKTMGGGFYDEGMAMAVDSDQNVYITGYFYEKIDFDPGPDSTFLTNDDGADMFIQKLNSNGELLWIKHIKSISGVFPYDMIIDKNGDIVITGYFSDKVYFNPKSDDFTSSININYDIFLIKFNSDGQFIWQKQYGGIEDDHGYLLKHDEDNNYIIQGTFQNTVSFKNSDNTMQLTANNENDVFLLKTDDSGNPLWVRGISFYQNISADIDNQNNIYLSGNFYNSLILGDQLDGGSLKSTNDLLSGFLLKINASGKIIWSKALDITDDSEGFVEINDISVGNSHIYFAGGFKGRLTYGVESIQANEKFGWVIKLNHDGQLEDMFTASSTNQEVHKILQKEKDLYVVSLLSGRSNIFFSEVKTSLFRLNDGNLLWSDELDNTYFRDFVVDAHNNLYFTGYINKNTDFFPGISEYTLETDAFRDYFVSKWSQCSMITQVEVYPNFLLAPDEGDEYQWINCEDESFIAGETSRRLNLDSIGSYAVLITKDGCSSRSSCVKSDIITSSIDQYSKTTIEAYPNPFNGKFKILSSNPLKQVILRDVLGKIVYKKSEINSTECDIEFIGNDELYILETTDNSNFKKSFKLLKR